MNIKSFHDKKKNQQKITMVTCYDYNSARLLAETEIDCLLVGDSVAMTMHGFKNTLFATMDMMCIHTAAVSRGNIDKFIISDLPFLSYRKSLQNTINAVQKLMQAGAHAVKLEGASGNLGVIKYIVESGVPVMGHLGLMPQFIHMLGGYKVQAKSNEAIKCLQQNAHFLQEAGCFAIVLECVPINVAQEITQSLSIPTIGIGAGPYTDGQVLVWHDLLGLNTVIKPKFLKAFAEGDTMIKKGIASFINAVKSGEYPDDEHSYGYY